MSLWGKTEILLCNGEQYNVSMFKFSTYTHPWNYSESYTLKPNRQTKFENKDSNLIDAKFKDGLPLYDTSWLRRIWMICLSLAR